MDDISLIKRIQFSEPHELNAAIEELLDKSRGIVTQIVLAGGGNQEEVNQILNDAVMDLYSIIKNGDFDTAKANWRTLIYRIAKNKWFDLQKENSRFKNRFSFTNFNFIPFTLSLNSPVEEEIFTKEDIEQINRALIQLDRTCLEFMKKIYCDGARLRTIAESSGISESALKKRHQRCKEKLKHIFGKDPRFE